MSKLAEIDWGPNNADDQDVFFREKWLETDNNVTALKDSIWIVSGEKGSGKSAIKRAINEIYHDKYDAICEIKYDDVSFKLLSDEIKDISTINIARTDVLSNFWQYTMVTHLAKEMSEKFPNQYLYIFQKFQKLESGVSEIAGQQPAALADGMWRKFDEVTAANKNSKIGYLTDHNLTAKAYHDLKSYPLDKNFIALKKEFFQLLTLNSHRTVIIFDELDKLNTNQLVTNEGLTIVFTGLIAAIQAFKKDKLLPPKFLVKALLPHDRLIAVGLRDSDKNTSYKLALKWSETRLQEFLQKRMTLSDSISDGGFVYMWNQILPPTIKNEFYNLDENSFQYILRHTLWRPRHLQIHLLELAKISAASDLTTDLIVDSIAESSKQIGDFFCQEFSTDHPHLEKFIKSLKGESNIIDFKKFKTIISNALKTYPQTKPDILVEDKINELYAMGFFGVLKFVEPYKKGLAPYMPPSKTANRHYVEFYYKKIDNSITSSLKDESLIAFHPIFVDFADLKPNADYIVG